MKFNIIREAGLFDITYQEDQEDVKSPKSLNRDAWWIMDIYSASVEGCAYKSLNCQIISNREVVGYIGSTIKLDENISGSMIGNGYGGYKWELSLKIKETGKSFLLKGNSGCRIESTYIIIGRSICNFINKCLLFESLDDFKEYEFIEKKGYDSDIEQRILRLSRIINLCKKYTDINPSLAITKQMRDWIDRNLKDLLKTYSVV